MRSTTLSFGRNKEPGAPAGFFLLPRKREFGGVTPYPSATCRFRARPGPWRSHSAAGGDHFQVAVRELTPTFAGPCL
jgi:hypothetical protein